MKVRAERHGRIAFVIFTGILMIPAFFVAIWATQGTLVDFHGEQNPLWYWWILPVGYLVFASYQLIRAWRIRR